MGHGAFIPKPLYMQVKPSVGGGGEGPALSLVVRRLQIDDRGN